ncbi:MAG: radical SAM protein [Candidatus Omnitrophica bacterium]|nr:radical SAM protein [Candidatus Omnitrophota bacterium]
MLNREVKAICPICCKPVAAKIYAEKENVILEKSCKEHGVIKDLLSTSVELFNDRMSLLDHARPNKCSTEKCSEGIFKCKDHIARKSPLAFIEITTRCNMNCPVCYADAASKGKDMPFEDVKRIIDVIQKEDPQTHIILIGGEPTIHPEFFGILDKISREHLMKRTFIATNAIKLADETFCAKVRKAGIKKFFLGFDGTDREACKEIRGSYIAYDSLRKALVNIRKQGKAWIILSITAVRNINVEDIPKALDFALDNSDIVKRVMISPEVYCGRINEKEDLSKNRLTGDCIEVYLRKELNIKVVAVPLSMFFVLINPLKSMGFLKEDSWMGAVPSPICGSMGLIWKDKAGKYHSIIDFLVKDADKNVYKLGRRLKAYSENLAAGRSRFRGNIFPKILWNIFVFTYFLPKYFFILFSYLNKKSLLKIASEFIKARFNIKKFKKDFFGKRIELFYLLGSDRYNFIWDKMPYCLTHHYRVHPRTQEIIKIPGCFVFSFREELEK